MEMASEDRPASRVSNWEETILGLLPVIVVSLAITLEGTGQSGITGGLSYIAILLVVALPAIGIPLALKRDLPPWSPPYIGLVVLDVLLVPTIFIKPLFDSTGAMLFLRGATILLLAYAVYRIIVLVLRNSSLTGPQVDHDWTQLLFGAQTLIPLMVMVSMDETALVFKTGWELAGGLILVAGALVYLRARSRWLGTAALLLSALLTVWLAIVAADVYWKSVP